MRRIHTICDSWGCREASGIDRGWEFYAGIDPECRNSIPGSTAEDWANDKNGILSKALKRVNAGDIVIMSMVGNDIRHAAEDGDLSIREIIDATKALYRAAWQVIITGADVWLMLYTDPYRGLNQNAASGVLLMNTIIHGVAGFHSCRLFHTDRILTMPDHFDGKDFHPTEAGHRAIADVVIRRFK